MEPSSLAEFQQSADKHKKTCQNWTGLIYEIDCRIYVRGEPQFDYSAHSLSGSSGTVWRCVGCEQIIHNGLVLTSND